MHFSFFLLFPVNCLPTPWFMLFLIFKPHVCGCYHQKVWPWGCLVATAGLKGLCLDGSILGTAHNPSVMARRRR